MTAQIKNMVSEGDKVSSTRVMLCVWLIFTVILSSYLIVFRELTMEHIYFFIGGLSVLLTGKTAQKPFERPRAEQNPYGPSSL